MRSLVPSLAQAALVLAVLLTGSGVLAQQAKVPPAPTRGDRLLADYFKTETARLEKRSLAEINSADDWNSRKDEYRRQLREMLGLEPLPPRTDLKPEITGRVDHPDFVVEKLVFQSRPGLYVTGNLYVPKQRQGKLPAILYVCGHGNNKKDSVSYGSKSFYQHHGGWLARNGYVCLILDTLQLGEIEGLHHGTYREGMWWWLARGYTPGGVEAWNGMRAIDYLQSRPEVNGEKIGVTGRSGGGAYSWFVAALDERVKAAVPVAGITDLQNHVVDGVVEGHCDCMFFVNSYRWDYPQLAAMVAPRPLLLSNTDQDPIFPLSGVIRTHEKVRRLYNQLGAKDRLGLLITEGPHKDTQDLQVPALRWFNRWLKGEDPLVTTAAEKFFQSEQLKVLGKLPEDQRNTQIHASFVPAAGEPAVPTSKDEWARTRDGWLARLRQESFAGWPTDEGPVEAKRPFTIQKDGVRLTAVDFRSQENVPLRIYIASRAVVAKQEEIQINVQDEAHWLRWLAQVHPALESQLASEEIPSAVLSSLPPSKAGWEALRQQVRSARGATAWLAPRGIGPTAWSGDPQKKVHVERRFYLLGQSLDTMRVWDLRRAIQTLRSEPSLGGSRITVRGEGRMAGIALYASLFEQDLSGLVLDGLPTSAMQGPYFLNSLKVLDHPAALAMAAERTRVVLTTAEPERWTFAETVVRMLRNEPNWLRIERQTR